jgi:hypothetical protein
VMIGHDPATDEETAEVAHEALIGAWGRLRGWLDENRLFGLWRQRLKVDLERWSGKPEEAFLRAHVLAEAVGWLASHREELNEREISFVEASRDNAELEAAEELRQSREREDLANKLAEERRRALEQGARHRARLQTRNRGLLAALAMLVLALAGAGYWAFESNRQATVAEEAAEAATIAAREAKGRQLGAEAFAIGRDLRGALAAERGAALAIEGWRRHPGLSAFQGAARALSTLPHVRVEHGGPVRTAFSPAGDLLATGSGDGTARLWRTPETVFGLLCSERAGRNLSVQEWRQHIGAIEEWAPTCAGWRSDPELLANREKRQ